MRGTIHSMFLSLGGVIHMLLPTRGFVSRLQGGGGGGGGGAQRGGGGEGGGGVGVGGGGGGLGKGPDRSDYVTCARIGAGGCFS